MIHREWRDPNFRYTAFGRVDRREYSGVVWAEDKYQLRERLKAKGYTDIQVDDYDFADWVARAEAATVNGMPSFSAVS